MTENQRDYLADLALKKGVVIDCPENVSASWASAKIEELKALPDAEFDEVTPAQIAEIKRLTNKAKEELHKWTFTQ